jgi:hypothetical protein
MEDLWESMAALAANSTCSLSHIRLQREKM